jgi:hypothetical protein
MIDTQAALAARNNASWCNAVCAAHGGAGQSLAMLWWNQRPSPPYYPNLITLDPCAKQADIEPMLAALQRMPGAAEFGVKDSFARLDLSGLGFERPFEAQWIFRPVDAGPLPRGELHWARIDEPEGLAEWEAGWWRGAGAKPTLRLFPPALLALPDVAFIGGYRAGLLRAGCALTMTEGVVGLACQFNHESDPASGDLLRAQRELIAAVQALQPGRPLVGYESGDALQAALRADFRSTGPLRVWLRRP